MRLYSESVGAGAEVVILHGLMGSCENWRHVASRLAPFCRVIALDLPNHGRSAHVARTGIAQMAADVDETLLSLGVTGPVALVGHSLGGKVAMRLACDRPERLRGLVVVDISPRAIPPVHLFVLRACLQLDLATATRRTELDAALARLIPQAATRAFLLKNVVRDAAGRWVWRVPLEALIDNYRVVSDAVELASPYGGPCLFVAGSESPFRLCDDEALIRDRFPAARFVTIPQAGHLVQSDNPVAFLDALRTFLGL